VVGDPLRIGLEPRPIGAEGFEVTYRFHRHDDLAAQGLTRHLAIDPERRQRCGLPEGIRRWLEASSEP
jgi:1,4-dihydroxy-2-naphthoyl-CoA hydrolase